MSLNIGAGGLAREALEIRIGAGGEARPVLEGWVGADGIKRQFYASTPEPPPAPPLTVTASPDALGWQTLSPGAYYVSNQPATATASGGTPPYTYLWRTSPGLATPDAEASATTLFHSGDGNEATAICTVTDSAFASADSNPVSLV